MPDSPRRTADDGSAGAARPPRPGLRERKKAATMHRIQAAALDLFGQHGFDAVSIEQVADAAEVSPSTVYRYFRTKEGLVVHDEYDDRVLELLVYYLQRDGDLAHVLTRVLDDLWEDHFVKDAGPSWERTRWCFEHPTIQGSMWVLVNEQAESVARAVSQLRRMPLLRARILASATVWGIVAVLRTWHEQDGTGDLRADLDQVVDLLSRLEGTPPAS
ncbi:TetR/AcrR family transcriptional regulator [Actinomyces sp. W5033]|uniref:TetR/AcrR family transcriptional regulator n=1 Tax=Actinomyces sp. W5033 TaxID=3446479 RepID=UPI003EDEBAAA